MSTTSTSTANTKGRELNPWYIAAVSGMASYIDSCAIISSGSAFVIYQTAYGLSDAQFGLLSSGLTFAIALGAIVGGRLGDRYGRKRVFSVTMAFIIAGSLLLTLSSSFAPLLAGVLLMGLGTGSDLPVSLATISEAASNENRGKLLGLSNLLWTVGIVAAQAIAALVGDWGVLGGKIMFGQICIVSVVILALRMTIPESRVWLEAHAAEGAGSTQETKVTIGDLVHGRYAKAFIALTLFYALVNLGANTNGQFNTWVNVNVIGMAVSLSAAIQLALFIAQIPLNMVFMKFVDTEKRMPLFYFGMVCFIGSYLIYPIFGFSTMNFVIMMTLNCIGQPFAFEGIMKVWAQESFPTMLRTTAQGTIVAVARFVAAIFGSFTASLISLSPVGAYVGLALLVAVGYAFALWGFKDGGKSVFSEEAEGE